MRISYDYEELIEEFQADIKEGLLKETCWIVRGDEVMDYRPIIDYYYDLMFVKEQVEMARTEDVLKEMLEMNEVI